MRAGHDPSVAAKNDTGNIAEADRALADSIGALLGVASHPQDFRVAGALAIAGYKREWKR